MSAMEVEDWQRDWESVEGEGEVELPLEIWCVILSHWPMYLDDLVSLTRCSHAIRAAVLDSGALYVDFGWQGAVWPAQLMNDLRSPRTVRVHNARGMTFRHPQLDDFMLQIQNLKLHSQRVNEHFYGDGTLYGNLEKRRALLASGEALYCSADGTWEDQPTNQMNQDADGEMWLAEEEYWSGIASPPPAPTQDLDTSASPPNELCSLQTEMDRYQAHLQYWLAGIGIPTTLTRLEVPFADFPVELLPPGLRTAVLPQTSFPHDLRPFPRSLTYLEVAGISSPYGYPDALATLKLHDRTPDISLPICDDGSLSAFLGLLPPALTSFAFAYPFSASDLALIPKSIAHLEINCERIKYCSDLVNLPRHLASLSLLNLRESITGKCFKYLPTQLRSLVLPPMSVVKNKCIASLPRTLTYLHLPPDEQGHLTHHAFPMLPPAIRENLTHLPHPFWPITAHMALKRFPVEWLEVEWPEWFAKYLPVECCADLPRDMSTLQVYGKSWRGELLGELPPNLEALYMLEKATLPPGEAALLPRTLTTLEMPACVPQLDTFADLPPNLLHLSMEGLWRQLLVDYEIVFPQKLVHLSLNMLLGPLAYKSLPETLQQLKVCTSHLQPESCKYLPRGLTSLDVPDDKLLTDSGVPFLPPGLIVLKLESNHLLTDTCAPLLPRGLLALLLPSNKRLTDAAVPLLPRTLVQIDFRSNPNFTDASFLDWPPSLACADFQLHSIPEKPLPGGEEAPANSASQPPRTPTTPLATHDNNAHIAPDNLAQQNPPFPNAEG